VVQCTHSSLLMAIPTVLWVATGGLRHPPARLKQSEPGLFSLVLAASGALASTAGVACRRFLQDS
jgi:hypothetical protein